MTHENYSTSPPPSPGIDSASTSASATESTFPEKRSKAITSVNVEPSELTLPPYRKTAILILLSTALFLDAFNALALSTALPVLSLQLDIPDNEYVWVFGAYQLTFSGSLLLCGRISDLYNPKWVFLVGSTSLTVFSVIAGFIRKEIPFLLLRALIGVGAALTIPSSQNLIVHMYPDPASQAKALAIFASFGGLGLVSGLFFGALFVQLATWSWIFYFIAITTGSISLSILFLVPNLERTKTKESHAEKLARFKRLDLFGVTLITGGLILFVFAVTSGSGSVGWGSAQVIAPLVLSVFLIVGFFVWEGYIPEEDAAVPPQVWKYENVGILLWAATIPFMWWSSIYPLFSCFWQLIEGWSPIKVALHFLPVVLGIFPVAPFTAHLPSKIPPKWIILFGLTFLVIANVLLPFENDGSSGRYWRFGFPGFLIGTIGAATIYSTTNIVLLATTPPQISGVISALFMASAQTGGAAGFAIVTSIQTSIQNRAIGGGAVGSLEFSGREDGLWFLLGVCGVSAVLVVVFMTSKVIPSSKPGESENSEVEIREK